MSLPTATKPLYRHFLRLASSFHDYNVRSYALRSVQTRFRETPTLDAAAVLEEERRMRRMVTIGGEYRPDELNVMQNIGK
ncbi:hypothetical protein TL16_g11106 [Triparma laevis f. inornata]|uniref:Complex 1 LYR protein domain-containing protein n=2 Tax=Triparma laevis TaxID=1534972 RepID=A0A9W6ZB96_9STRA|nr:hypothetical protein TrLO_g9942 [Triparma laevis f. longispina]GMH88263.1 hypothetical protein TL16_g11106 [Triparma laevis f. inornata]